MQLLPNKTELSHSSDNHMYSSSVAIAKQDRVKSLFRQLHELILFYFPCKIH
jgi:hypothetical protein